MTHPHVQSGHGLVAVTLAVFCALFTAKVVQAAAVATHTYDVYTSEHVNPYPDRPVGVDERALDAVVSDASLAVLAAAAGAVVVVAVLVAVLLGRYTDATVDSADAAVLVGAAGLYVFVLGVGSLLFHDPLIRAPGDGTIALHPSGKPVVWGLLALGAMGIGAALLSIIATPESTVLNLPVTGGDPSTPPRWLVVAGVVASAAAPVVVAFGLDASLGGTTSLPTVILFDLPTAAALVGVPLGYVVVRAGRRRRDWRWLLVGGVALAVLVVPLPFAGILFVLSHATDPSGLVALYPVVLATTAYLWIPTWVGGVLAYVAPVDLSGGDGRAGKGTTDA